MTLKLSPRCFSAAALLALLVALLLPMQAAVAGGCCYEVTIKSLDTGRVVVVTRGDLILGYDLSAFTAFTDFKHSIAAPARPGPAYEVSRDGWDHLLYYPGVGDAPGAVYYEGLFNGSSEYDHQWFVVPPEQDAALRASLAALGLSAAPAGGLLPPLTLIGLAGFSLISLVGAWLSRRRTIPAPAALDAPRTESDL